MKIMSKGFTLVELIVVITILAILGTIAFISLQGYSQDAKNSKVASDIRTIVTSVETKLTEGKISMANVVDDTIDLKATSANGVDDWSTTTFGSGITLSSSTYKVGAINFTWLRQSGDDFKDNEGNEYIAAVAINGSDNSYYQIVGQQKNADATYTAVVKGNYVQVITGDTIWLVSETSWNDWIVNGEIISTLY